MTQAFLMLLVVNGPIIQYFLYTSDLTVRQSVWNNVLYKKKHNYNEIKKNTIDKKSEKVNQKQYRRKNNNASTLRDKITKNSFTLFEIGVLFCFVFVLKISK